MNSLRKKKDQDSFTIGITILLLSSFVIPNYTYLTSVLLFISLLLVYKTRGNVLCFCSTLIVAYANYSFVIYRYWKTDLMPYNEITLSTGNIDVTGLRISIFLIYVICLFIHYKLTKLYNGAFSIGKPNKPNNNNHNSLLVLVSCFALIYIWFNYFEFSFGEKSGYSPQYEYSTVFFIIGLKYAGEKWYLKVPVMILALFYITFDFMGGQRSTGVQISIIVALMVFYHLLTPKRILVAGLIGMTITSIVATLRAALFMPDFTLQDVFSEMSGTWFASDTAGHAYYTSLTYLGTMNYYSLAERLSQFGDFIASLIVTGTVGEALPYIAEKHYYHNFGGVLGIYMYYYLGYLGTFLIGVLVAFYYVLMNKVKLINNKPNGIAYIVSVYVSATTLRWYLYSPSQLLRGVMLLILVYYAFNLVDGFMKSVKVYRVA